MAIKKYISNKDTTISNAFMPGLIYRATGSNMGEADSLEVFTIFGQQSSSSLEMSRILIEFPIESIFDDRTNGIIPASGSVSFYLNLYNAEHPFTLPRKFMLDIQAISQSFEEGWGVDADEYTDFGVANWISAATNSSGIVNWNNPGGDFHTAVYTATSGTLPSYTYYFEKGYENLNLDITSLVEEWLANTQPNNGIVLKMISGIENSPSSSYTKKFYARGSEYFFKRPNIQALWDSSIKDNRANFVVSSSLLSSVDNINTIYLYNSFRGQLKNIPLIGTGSIYVQIWSDITSGITGSTLLTPTPIIGGHVKTGVYSASFSLNTTLEEVYDRWYDSTLTQVFHTGTIKINNLNASDYNPNQKYVMSMPNLKDSYDQEETARLRLFTRQKDWSPNIYTVINPTPETEIVEDIYYQIKRVTDNLVVVNYGTGSTNHTRLSYDVSGSYFDFDMSLLETGYMYEINFVVKLNNTFQKQKEVFKFRVG
jgi:hypothetical protein